MSVYLPLPQSTRTLLQRYRLLARESVQANPTGGQLMRRKGQSLEFRDYIQYTPGDDVRFIDWRASARSGSKDDLVIRSFVAEEQLQILVSIDPRATMRLPVAMSKLQMACWLAEALGYVAHQTSDRIYWHWLFDQRPSIPMPISGAAQMQRILANPPSLQEEQLLNLQHVRLFLPPTAIWLVVSDLYFEHDAARALSSAISAAQAGMCWVVVIELDSWPHERALMGNEVWQLTTRNARAPVELVQLTTPNLLEVERRIKQHREDILTLAHVTQPDHRTWEWPSDSKPDQAGFFNDKFMNEQRIQSMFAKQHI